MKTLNKYLFILAGGLIGLSSCNDFLDLQPLDRVTPDNYLWTENDLAAYAIKGYDFPAHAEKFSIGSWGDDNDTDNQASSSYNNKWIPGQWKVSESIKKDDDPWNFEKIRNANYFIETVIPRYTAGKIEGVDANIRHYIGEVYLQRAWNYFSKLQKFGDFPIIRNTLLDEEAQLVEASKRKPQNEVAHFIINDLDSALLLLGDKAPSGGKNRITRNVALLIKSRVALYEASWLTYHKGTALVPGGTGWPGGDYTGKNLDEEIAFFLKECKAASKELADKNLLAVNTDKTSATTATDLDNRGMKNPYFAQFALVDMDAAPEILLWKRYDFALGVRHGATSYITSGGNTGFTRQYVETFLCRDGLPTYASPMYKSDKTIANALTDRESRLNLFMMRPDEHLDKQVNDKGEFNGNKWAIAPNIIDNPEVRSVTGYGLRKGLAADTYHKGGDQTSVEGSAIFRAAEAYLNYLEADCMENGGNSISGQAEIYWKAIRDRANLPDYTVTLNATDLSKESDWGVYSAGKMVSPLLYCIRRERRCEMVEEGLRMMDLRRWRALDQVNGFQVQGVNLWGSDLKDAYMEKDKDDKPTGKSKLIPEGQPNANVSSQANSGDYLHPYRIISEGNNLAWDGYKWCEAHYLTPIALHHFKYTSSDPNDLSTSVIYQNPGWPLTSSGAIGY
ncbi:RagB/SusD family nutrient uptake outer membrane protein [Bacteroides sp.]